MKAIVGVFKSRSDAERGAAELGPLEIPKDRINILTPEATDKAIAAVPTVAGEQPGMGKAMGAVVGGAMGVAGGAGLAPAIASLLVPGVGPVLGIGILAGTLLGAIGAIGGGAVGAALENEFEGLPEDEFSIPLCLRWAGRRCGSCVGYWNPCMHIVGRYWGSGRRRSWCDT